MADIQREGLDHATLCSSCGTVFADLTAVAISVRERFLRKIDGEPPHIDRHGCRLCFDINSTILKFVQNGENTQLNPPVQFEVIYQWIRVNDKIHQDLIITIYKLNPNDGSRDSELDSTLVYEIVPDSGKSFDNVCWAVMDFQNDLLTSSKTLQGHCIKTTSRNTLDQTKASNFSDHTY